ncbi:PaaI family thioesterase [Jatrophihabitans telluris]|uniref:PaaI family thioesterase n=1 Tax=Jatrophihabitans telluris TaxID=2038343 RepID=A0ABY4R1D8_9ACTN|nr:PaaI family thioesterase [Jatrophihabitans telluris]UQX89609.1 PaaI family thioesterase [Jatrophihabitans telluris]
MTENQTDTAAPTQWGSPRSKTLTWFDPAVTAASLIELSGLDAMRAVADGTVAPPPIAAHFAFTIESVESGAVVFTCVPDESAYNPIGMVHGGLVCTLLDTVIGCAVHTTLPPRVGYTSIELKVNYLRPVHSDGGALTARGWVVKPGRRVAFAEGSVIDGDGKLVATASGSCLIMTP